MEAGITQSNVDILGCILSFLPMAISLFSLCWTLKYSKIDNLLSVSKSINEAKGEYLKALEKYYKNSGEQEKYFLNECATNYANTFEVACCLYCRFRISRGAFRSLHSDEIISFLNGEGAGTYLEIPDDQPEALKHTRKFRKSVEFFNRLKRIN